MNLVARRWSNIPQEIYHVEKRGEILGRIRGQNTGTTIGRFCHSEVCLSEHLAKSGIVEGRDGGVDAEKYVSAQDFDVPVLEVEDFMRGYGR